MQVFKPHLIEAIPNSMALDNRHLNLFTGYYLDAWQLVGGLYAIETVATYRMQKMWDGLRRLNVSVYDAEYVTLHIECDEHHSAEWRDLVIKESIEKQPELKEAIARGIALTLELDFIYLDDLLARSIQ